MENYGFPNDTRRCLISFRTTKNEIPTVKIENMDNMWNLSPSKRRMLTIPLKNRKVAKKMALGQNLPAIK